MRKKRCKQCFIKEGTALLYDFFAVGKKSENQKNVTVVSFSENGLCQYCEAYNLNFDREYINEELSDFILNSDSNSEYQAFVALSGGKDSLAALSLAVEVFEMKVIAFTYDNGFIPQEIIKQSEKICKKLNVPYIVVKKELYNEFKNEYQPDKNGVWKAKTGIDFCQICSGGISLAMKRLVEDYKINKIIFGNKIYSQLYPKVSSIKKLKFLINEEEKEVITINFLYALQINSEIQTKVLNGLGWIDPKLPGYTSNCLIPGFVEYSRSKKIRTHSDAGYIERELRSNLYTKEEAKELIFAKKYIDPSSKITEFFQHI